jgi:hypothetical protein
MNFPKIVPLFDYSSDPEHDLLYCASLRSSLQKILPCDFSPDVQDMLPLLKFSAEEKGISVFLLCPFRPHASKFFQEMMSRWLIPGKTLHVGLFFTIDFKLPELSSGVYTFAEIHLRLSNDEESVQVKRALSILENELKLGVSSSFHASRILEIKGLSPDEKTALIQQKINRIVHKRPMDFDDDIFSQMQHFLVFCKEEFKELRDCHHMSRIISILYVFQKMLLENLEISPERRHLYLKLLPARLSLAFGVKPVLSVFVGMNFLGENEVFDERHLFKAFSSLIPGIKIIEDSIFHQLHKDKKTCAIYLEVEKENGEKFTAREIAHLRQRLSHEIKSQIEHLIRPIFMPRNEEEVMRNIVTLSKQVKFARDLPHVILSFDTQSENELSFNVILVRILPTDAEPIEDIFKKIHAPYKIAFDRIKKIGRVRGKYVKEASVMRLKIPVQGFLRGDHSVDLYKARQEVLWEIQRLIGEVRDYNGGMIAKQMELFFALQKSLGKIAQRKEFLLENFFHSIFPIEWRSTLALKFLAQLFFMLLHLEKTEKDFEMIHEEYANAFFVLVTLKDARKKEEILANVADLEIPATELVFLYLKREERVFIGYVYLTEDPQKRQRLLEEAAGKKWTRNGLGGQEMDEVDAAEKEILGMSLLKSGSVGKSSSLKRGYEKSD